MDEDDAYKWQKTLYKKIGCKQENKDQTLESSVANVLAMAKVLQGLHMVRDENSSGGLEMGGGGVTASEVRILYGAL